MALPITIPKLGWSTEPVKLVEWAAKEGGWVERGSNVLVITSEKISFNIEAEQSGYLHILVEEGKESNVNSVVGYLAETKEELETLNRKSP
jgi:dihydrolipoamide dehydrogenase